MYVVQAKQVTAFTHTHTRARARRVARRRQTLTQRTPAAMAGRGRPRWRCWWRSGRSSRRAAAATERASQRRRWRDERGLLLHRGHAPVAAYGAAVTYQLQPVADAVGDGDFEAAGECEQPGRRCRRPPWAAGSRARGAFGGGCCGLPGRRMARARAAAEAAHLHASDTSDYAGGA